MAKDLDWMVEEVEFESPKGTQFRVFVSYALGLNKWVVDPEIAYKTKESEVYSVITQKIHKNIFGSRDKQAAISFAKGRLFDLAQWI